MVQEVQKGVGVYNETTLETIEAVGTSSRKIIEGRQTRGEHYVISCKGTGANPSRQHHEGGPHQSPLVKGPITISSMEGKQEFIVSEGGIRVPSGGTYQITAERWGGVYDHWSTTFYIIKGTQSTDEVLFQQTSNNREKITSTITVDLGKFDIITVWNSYYDELDIGETLGDTSSISIKQL